MFDSAVPLTNSSLSLFSSISARRIGFSWSTEVNSIQWSNFCDREWPAVRRKHNICDWNVCHCDQGLFSHSLLVAVAGLIYFFLLVPLRNRMVWKLLFMCVMVKYKYEYINNIIANKYVNECAWTFDVWLCDTSICEIEFLLQKYIANRFNVISGKWYPNTRPDASECCWHALYNFNYEMKMSINAYNNIHYRTCD